MATIRILQPWVALPTSYLYPPCLLQPGSFLLSPEPLLPTTVIRAAQPPVTFITCTSHQHLLTGYPVS